MGNVPAVQVSAFVPGVRHAPLPALGVDPGVHGRKAQQLADDKRQGWLTELMWEPVNHFRIGVGYNFTDFSDNEFSDNDYSLHGWFTRIQATF